MKNKIKELHNKLSGTKIDSFDSVINTSSFSSVLKDRFVSELNKMNIVWDLSPTTINKLTKKKLVSKPELNKSLITIPEIKINNGIGVGIDIQFINDLPIVKDPWEDQFYKDNFKKSEIAHCLKKKNIFQSFAGIFAVKEAIFKIDSTEIKDIIVKFTKDGKPFTDKYSISISHDHDYAVGVAVLNTENNSLNEIEKLNNNINKNTNVIKKLESKININLNKNKRFFIIYFLISIIFSYIFYKDFLVLWFS
jgi:phosphopantetheinyl transferase (holo-ACP synthase)